MPPQQNQNYFWCSFEAHQSNSITIQYVVLAAQLAISIMLIYAYITAKRHGQFDRIFVVYKLIAVWLICTFLLYQVFFLKTLINVMAYSFYIQESPSNVSNISNNGNQQQIDFTGLRILSSIFLLLDSITTFFLQIAMIYIPYLWMRNALQMLTDQNLSVSNRLKIYRISWFLNLVRKYLILRNIYLVYFITVAIIVTVSDSFRDFETYLVLITIIESIVIMIVYPFGLWTFYIIKKNIDFDQKLAKSILVEYSILLLCNLVRIFLNSMFYFSDAITYIPDKYCYDDHDADQTTINCLFLVFGLTLMHIFPGIMILYVYWPSKKQNSGLRSSLLISQNKINS